MRVEVRLFATFAELAPSGLAGDPIQVILDEFATLSDLITHLGIRPEDVHLSIVNGRPVHDRSLRLSEADRIGLFPPVGGG